MTNSMTGYGRASAVAHGREITLEIRSVNHRYFEISVRTPRLYSYLEDKIKSVVQSQVSRGKIEVGLTVINLEGGGEEVELDMQLARSYAAALERMSRELGIPNDGGAETIARFPDVFSVRRVVPDEEEAWTDVRQVLLDALARYCEMRAAEGDRLKQDINERLCTVAARVGEVEARSETRLERYRERLATRMKTVLEATDFDENRILLEAAVYADKSAIDEETVRLRSHLSQFADIFASDEPIGRKLDFLIQEINREINTIGSKAGDLDITATVIDLKAEIEKIREQIQNIE